METEAEILAAIAEADVGECDIPRLMALLELAEKLAGPQAASGMISAIGTVVLRAVELRLLCDPRLRQLALYWDAMVGSADSIITEHIQAQTGVQPPKELVQYLKACLRSHASRGGDKASLGNSTFRTVAESRLEAGQDFRCHHCGYHFRREDLGKDKTAIIDDVGATFSSTVHPRRLTDPLKPHQIRTFQGGQKALTGASMDHLTPEAGFGWTDPDNLVFACQFCNQGRMIYRRGPEPFSVIIAASGQGCPSTREHSIPRQVAVVASILSQRRTCNVCGLDASCRELTCWMPDSEVNALRWITPWSVKVICYDCLRDTDDSGPGQ